MAKPRPIDVVLTPMEEAMAVTLGTGRQEEALQSKRKDQHGFDGKKGLQIHIEGAAGEIAFAKAFGLYPGFTINTFKAADIGANIQVRTRSDKRYGLIVRPDDADDSIFVHVIGARPNYAIMGWMLGWTAKAPMYVQTYGDRPPAYFVPSEDLRDLSDLLVTPVRLPQRPAETHLEHAF